MKIELPNMGHRNLVPFEGVGLLVDVPTDTPVTFKNHDTQEDAPYSLKLIFKRSAVEAALPTILGMGVCIEAQNFNGHAPRSKVGLVTEAWLEGNELRLRGFLYGLDFPDVVDKLAKLRNTLGMCPAFRDFVTEPTADAETIAITGLTFSGVAILARRTAHFGATTVRFLARPSYRWPCKESKCPAFVYGEVQGFCSLHQPKR